MSCAQGEAVEVVVDEDTKNSESKSEETSKDNQLSKEEHLRRAANFQPWDGCD